MKHTQISHSLSTSTPFPFHHFIQCFAIKKNSSDEIIKMCGKNQIKSTNTSKCSPSEAIVRQRCSIGVRTQAETIERNKEEKHRQGKSQGKGTHFFFHFILSISLQPTRTFPPCHRRRIIRRRKI